MITTTMQNSYIITSKHGIDIENIQEINTEIIKGYSIPNFVNIFQEQYSIPWQEDIRGDSIVFMVVKREYNSYLNNRFNEIIEEKIDNEKIQDYLPMGYGYWDRGEFLVYFVFGMDVSLYYDDCIEYFSIKYPNINEIKNRNKNLGKYLI